jgi:ABC-type lipoprotein export system ATPase subunit
MKIEYLEIKNYKQFTDLTLDLTYPKGHEKEGQPLDKICIIGQSGTGKTNLLEIIRDKKNADGIKTVFLKEEDSSFGKIYFSAVEKSINSKTSNNKISVEDKKIIDDLQRTSHKLLITDNGDYETSSWQHQSIHEAIKSIEKKYNSIIQSKDNIKKLFININDSESWSLLKEKINNYDVEKSKYTRKLSNKLVHYTEYSKENFILDIKRWEGENENILEKIADDVNRIINKFNLELKIDEDTNSYEELLIKDLSNGNIINYEDVSTGTKNLLSTLIPLHIHKPKDSIILIDEPENSFYPDIQRELTDLYMNVGENNQLIMATHSPLIASSFEPWEVVELKFDKNNQIYREKYYESDENHIDNYTRDPRMLTWTGILTDIFDLKEDSNFIFREKKLMEYAMLKNKIKTISDIEEKEKLFKELQKFGKQLGLYNQ